uniref:DUF1232 domain-containing protein n=1 Tax=uncultured Elusimicrobia bacterium TaxID=699876 RepID=A0A650EN50_9BACT|nr:hypothetical protein Elusimicrob1349_0780 [uncultured Elusimicrobia bacterium]
MKFSPTTVFTDVSSFFPMLWAVLRGKYKMPWNTLFWALLCLVYVVSPIDLLPDVLPVLGITDDGAFILLVLSLLHNDLAAFRHQRKKDETVLEAEVVRPEENKK